MIRLHVQLDVGMNRYTQASKFQQGAFGMCGRMPNVAGGHFRIEYPRQLHGSFVFLGANLHAVAVKTSSLLTELMS